MDASDELPLRDRVALITGGGWNIGRASALELARAGARIVVVGRRRERLDETVALLEQAGGEGSAFVADVLSAEAVRAAVEHAIERFGRLDHLAAIAGGPGVLAPADELVPEEFARTIGTNLTGTFHAVHAALGALSASDAGSIVTCGGGGTCFPLLGAHAIAYATAKAGLARFTDQLAVELFERGVRVNCVLPGKVLDPERLAAIEEEERASGTPCPEREGNRPASDAAVLVRFLLSPESAPLTGRIVSVEDSWWRDADARARVMSSQHAFCLRRNEPAEVTP